MPPQLTGVRRFLGFNNPHATNGHLGPERFDILAGQLLETSAIEIIQTLPHPDHIGETDEELAAASNGGDSMVREAGAALLGIKPNDPETTAANLIRHARLLGRTVYIALAGGNGNNWPLSALGKYAHHPEQLAEAPEAHIGEHRPIYYQVVDSKGDHRMSHVAMSCLGLGAPRLAAEDMDEVKSTLRNDPPLVRTAKEAAVAFGSVLSAPTISLRVGFVHPSGEEKTLDLQDIVGLEFIGSRIYAKQGRTQVNVDDTRWQPIVMKSGHGVAGRLMEIADTSVRLRTGQHAIRPIDLADLKFWIENTGNNPVPFHADGEFEDMHSEADAKEEYQLEPGDRLHGGLSKLAIRTLIVRPDSVY